MRVEMMRKENILHLGANGSRSKRKDTTEKPKYNISTLKRIKNLHLYADVTKCK